MSAKIETFEDKAAFASARELPWHRLGTTVDHAMTAEEALSLAHLSDWDVRTVPNYAMVGEGEFIPVEESFAVVRTNPFTGQPEAFSKTKVGSQYVATQNEEHAEFLNTLVDESGAHFETAGSLDGGKRVFISMKMPGTVNVGGVDPVDTYITAANSHDGTSAFTVITTPVRVVCSNTLAAALGGAQRVAKVRHTAGNGGAIARVRESLQISFKYMDEFDQEVERMVQESLTKGQFDKIVSQLYPTTDDMSDLQAERAAAHRGNLNSLFTSSPTLTEVKGTRWAGYNAVTEYIDHFVTVPGAGDFTELAATKRAGYNLTGKTDAIKESAFQLFAV